MGEGQDTLAKLFKKEPEAERIFEAVTMGKNRLILTLQQNHSRMSYMLSILRSCMRYDSETKTWVIKEEDVKNKDHHGLLTNVL